MDTERDRRKVITQLQQLQTEHNQAILKLIFDKCNSPRVPLRAARRPSPNPPRADTADKEKFLNVEDVRRIVSDNLEALRYWLPKLHHAMFKANLRARARRRVPRRRGEADPRGRTPRRLRVPTWCGLKRARLAR